MGTPQDLKNYRAADHWNQFQIVPPHIAGRALLWILFIGFVFSGV